MQPSQSTYGLIGFPIEHSLSPFMHNTAFKALGVDAVYKLFPLQEEELELFFADLREPGSHIFGINVTVPYKEKVIKYLDGLSPFADQVRAVNTVVISKKRKLTGHNTDGPGFLAHLAELECVTKGKRVAILGAGGASRALVSSLCLVPDRPEKIKIYDVDQVKADELIRDLGLRMDVGHVESVKSIDDLNIELADLLINATPLGLKKEDPVLVNKELLHPHMMVYDLIYNPRETPLLKLAKERGAKTSNGLGMLYYQGVLAFQHWAEIQLAQPIKDKMRRSLEKGKVI